MGKTPLHAQDIANMLESLRSPFVALPKIDPPFSTVKNRAKCTDFSKDLLPRFGVERVLVNGAVRVFGESGPNGEQVWKPLNDFHDSCRFIVRQSGGEFNSSSGQGFFVGDAASYMEVTFYGTGFNLLSILYNNAATQISYSVDGAGYTALTAFTPSNLADGKNWNPNQILKIVHGLPLGLHTIRVLTTGADTYLQGYEIVNATSSINLVPGVAYSGGKELRLNAPTTTPYNTVDIGSLNSTKGGRVVVYMDTDGTIKKAGTPVDATTLHGPFAADHTNEEVIREYHWREFGAGRSDDFSTLATTSSRSFILDDNTTGLAGVNTNVSSQRIFPQNGGETINFTFTGTGLDIVIDRVATTTTVTFLLDNQSSYSAVNPTLPQVCRVFSGLPYGTHTFSYRHTGGIVPLIKKFIVYGPKKPDIPEGAVELADYYVVANYADGAAVQSSSVADNVSHPTGVISKGPYRECVHTGANWATADVIGTLYHKNITCGTNNGQPVELTFFGTGVVVHLNGSSAGTYDYTVHIDGVLNDSGVAVAAATNLGGGSYRCTNTTAAAPSRVKFTGLPLGVHTIRLTRSAGAGNFNFNAFHVITPIGAPKGVGPDIVQSNNTIGSCAIRDRRAFSLDYLADTSRKPAAIAAGISSSPSTTSTSDVPLPDMCATIETKGGAIQVDWSSDFAHDTANGDVIVAVFVDGVQVQQRLIDAHTTTGQRQSLSASVIVQAAPGTHTVQVLFKTNTGTLTAFGTRRTLSVRELP